MVLLPRKMNVERWGDYVRLVRGDARGRRGPRRPADAGRDGPLRQLGDGRLRPRARRLPHLRHRPDAGQPATRPLFESFRQKTGQTILAKNGDFDKIEAVLAAGGVVATLGDQDAGERGLFVEFFGRPASTHKAVALLAIQHDAVMVVCGTPRVAEPMHYDLVVEDRIDPRDYAGRPDAVKAITDRYTRGARTVDPPTPGAVLLAAPALEASTEGSRRKAA